jgi:hypothetical protein
LGTVPNIFDNLEYLGQGKDAQSLDLVFGTSEEVSTTLESLGCTSDTLKRYGKVLTETAVSFEIIGILGKVF